MRSFQKAPSRISANEKNPALQKQLALKNITYAFHTWLFFKPLKLYIFPLRANTFALIGKKLCKHQAVIFHAFSILID